MTADFTYYKLKTGDWGIKGPVKDIKPGRAVKVLKKSTNEIKSEVVKKLICDFKDGNGIASIEQDEHYGRTTCKECKGPLVNAPHHRAMEGYCGHCAFDEFDM